MFSGVVVVVSSLRMGVGGKASIPPNELSGLAFRLVVLEGVRENEKAEALIEVGRLAGPGVGVEVDIANIAQGKMKRRNGGEDGVRKQMPRCFLFLKERVTCSDPITSNVRSEAWCAPS